MLDRMAIAFCLALIPAISASATDAEAKRYMDRVEAELRKGEKLLKARASDADIGKHSRRMDALIQEGDRLPDKFLQCGRIGAFAYAIWLHGMLGTYNGRRGAQEDYRRASLDYDEIRGKCKQELDGTAPRFR